MELAGAILRARQQRFEWFDRHVLSEPAWDILLALFVEDGPRGRLDVRSLAKLTQCSPDTLRRWLSLLAERELIQPAADGDDLFSLSILGEEKMQRLLESWSDHFVSVSRLSGRSRA